MAPERTLYSGNRVKGVYVGDRDLFMKKFYDPQRLELHLLETMELSLQF